MNHVHYTYHMVTPDKTLIPYFPDNVKTDISFKLAISGRNITGLIFILKKRFELSHYLLSNQQICYTFDIIDKDELYAVRNAKNLPFSINNSDINISFLAHYTEMYPRYSAI